MKCSGLKSRICYNYGLAVIIMTALLGIAGCRENPSKIIERDLNEAYDLIEKGENEKALELLLDAQSHVDDDVSPALRAKLYQLLTGPYYHAYRIGSSKEYAAKVELEKTLGGFSVIVGGDYAYTDHLQDFTSHITGEAAAILRPATDDVTQHLYSGFLSFDWKMSDKWVIYGGMRYDATRTKYVRNSTYEKDLSKSYEDLLPDIGVQFRSPVTLSLSFRQKVYRPSYTSLSNNYTYVTPTHWETGNPYLMKMKAQTLRLDLSYRKFMIQAEAIHYGRKIGLSCRFDPEINATVSQTVNLPAYNMLQLVALQQLDVKRWHPTLQGVLVLQDLNFGNPKRPYHYPFYQFSLNNRFDLPQTFYAYLSFFVRGTGNIETQSCGASWQTALTISKKLGNWNFTLTANDILGTWRQKVTTITNDIDFSSDIKGASQYVSLSIRFRFKSAKKTYTGKSVRKDEINRL